MEHNLVLRLGLALLFGAVIGFEREYRSKAAGFRTITIITVGATLFTIISYKLGYKSNNPDRIASNIITGIGFIGAGVIFKDSFSVSGLTTAATIWIAAAIGMALGIGEYLLAGVTLGLSILVLAAFEKIQDWIDAIHQVKNIKITFRYDYETAKHLVEEELKKLKLSYTIKRSLRNEDEVVFVYGIAGNQQQLDRFADFLIATRDIKGFDE